jgi:hypothetical protein
MTLAVPELEEKLERTSKKKATEEKMAKSWQLFASRFRRQGARKRQ